MDNKYLSLEQVAEYLHIGHTLAWQLVRSGKIKSHKVGRLVRIHPAAVEAYLAANVRPVLQLNKSKKPDNKIRLKVVS